MEFKKPQESNEMINRIDQELKGEKSNQKRLPIEEEDEQSSSGRILPHEQLPRPEVPSRIQTSRSETESFFFDMPAIGEYIRQRSTSFTSAITRTISSIKDRNDSKIAEFNITGVKITVEPKKNDDHSSDDFEIKGRISFFSRSNCRDCTAVRTFFRERGLKFVEINIDVFPLRENELIERTGSSSVPQIFFNEKLLGGLVALNSLRNSGLFEDRLKEMLRKKFSASSPQPPEYGFDDPEEERGDELIGVVRVLRQRLPIQDRLLRMKMVKNCFAGSEMVDVIVQQLECEREKAVEIGRKLATKHFIHHVFRENDFEDGAHFYSFLEHEPSIIRCVNFRGTVNDREPKRAAMVIQKLTKIMVAILESYASDDRLHIDYIGVSKSEEFRRYLNVVEDLHRINLDGLSEDEKLTFFLNLHNAMVIHFIVRGGRLDNLVDRRSFLSDFQYLIGGYPYALNTIRHGILRKNKRIGFSLFKPFKARDKRLQLMSTKVNPLIHFGLCYGTRSSPSARFFLVDLVESELKTSAREHFIRGGVEVDLAKRIVYLTRIIKWFSADFGSEKEILRWILTYLDPTNAGLVTHLLGTGHVNVVYQRFDWSLNF